MSTIRTLSMKFTTDEGKNATISVPYCRDDLEAQGVRDAMDAVIASQVFTHGLAAKKGAQVIERTVTELF